MSIKPENIQKFKDVAQFLADDLKRLEAAGQKQEEGRVHPRAEIIVKSLNRACGTVTGRISDHILWS